MSGRELDRDGTDSYHPEHPWEQVGHRLYLPPQYRSKANWPPRDAQPVGPHEQAEWESGLEDPADFEPCDAEMHTFDYFKSHHDIDGYWMRCDLIGPHEEHENSHTGAKWRDAE